MDWDLGCLANSNQSPGLQMSLDEKLCQGSTSDPSQHALNKRITSSLIFLPVFIVFLSAKSILTPIARQKMPMEIQVP